MTWVWAAEDGVKIGDFALAAEAAEALEMLAIASILIGVVVAVVSGLVVGFNAGVDSGVDRFKQSIARGLLVGLDLLIAADVIKTVTLEGTLESAAVLGILVVIRTFLSWTLILEVEERWPWQRSSFANGNGPE
jgi:uncharacterized membrane protein